MREAFGLTPRQLDVLRLAAKGMTNKLIGLRLGIAEQTVKNHCWAIYQAFGLPRERRNKTSAVLWAIRLGQIEVE